MIYIEQYDPNIRINGLNTQKNAVFEGTVGVTGVLTATAGVTTPAGLALKSGTAVPATAGAIAAGAPITMFSSGIKIWVTSNVPTHTATKGDICINTGGSSTSTRMYVNDVTENLQESLESSRSYYQPIN